MAFQALESQEVMHIRYPADHWKGGREDDEAEGLLIGCQLPRDFSEASAIPFRASQCKYFHQSDLCLFNSI